MGNAGTVPAPTTVEVKNVLVPLDGSELALQALPTARVLGARFGAELHTVTVVNGQKDSARASRLGAAALDVPDGDNRVLVVTGHDPADAITERANSLGSCLVCLATHGRGRLGGALVGSVARSVVQRSREPVVVLGPMADNPGWSPRPRSWPEPMSVARIVACVDGSETSEQVLPLAIAWAQALDMSLTIVTATDADPSPIGPGRVETRYGQHPDAASYIERLVEESREEIQAVDGAVLRDPSSPASAIRRHLEERPAGLLALTTHARSGMERVLGGAAAANIVHASTAPCLVAKVRA